MELPVIFQYSLNGIVTGMHYALLAVGLSLVFGVLHIVNFAHGEFYMLGGYFAYALMLYIGMPYFAALPAAMILISALAFISNILIIKPLKDREILATFLATFGLSYILREGAYLIWGGLPKTLDSPLAGTMRFAGLYLTKQNFAIIVVSSVFFLGLSLFVKRTALGKMMRATHQDKVGATLVGININLVYSWTYVIGCGLASVAGVLIGAVFSLIPTMGELALFKAFTVVILGGMGSISGALLGGLIVGVAESLGAAYVSVAFKGLFGFVLAIIILLFMPQGLMGERER